MRFVTKMFMLLTLVIVLTGCTSVVQPSADELLNGSFIKDNIVCYSYSVSMNIDMLIDLGMLIDKADFKELKYDDILPVSIQSELTYNGNDGVSNIKGTVKKVYPDETKSESMNKWYEAFGSGTVVYTQTDINYEKEFVEQKFQGLFGVDTDSLVSVSLRDTSINSNSYIIDAKIDWYGLNKMFHLDDSIDYLREYGINFDDIIFDLELIYNKDDYTLNSINVCLNSDMQMKNRSLIFDGFKLSIYADYSTDYKELSIPDEVIDSHVEVEDETLTAQTDVITENTIKLDMMTSNENGYNGVDFMSKVREYFGLSDVKCTSLPEYDTAVSTFNAEDYSLTLSIQIFRGNNSAEDFMVEVNEEFYMNYLSEYFGGDIINKSEDGKIYVYSVSKYNPVEIHILDGNAIISIVGSTDEDKPSDTMFSKIDGFIEFIER